MPTWNEQIAAIGKLREQRRNADEDLYAIQIELIRAEQALKRIRNGQPDISVSTEAIDVLRKRIAALEERLRELDKKIKEINNQLQRIKEFAEKINFIEKKIQLLTKEANQARAALAVETDQLRPDRNKITELELKLEKINESLRELKKEIDKLRAEPDTLIRDQQQLLATKAELERERKRLQEELKDLEEQLGEKLNSASGSIEETERKKRELEEKKKRARATLDNTIRDLHLAVEAVYVDPHPRSVVNNLDDSIPFLFLPVRIETRFMITDSLRELWLRIYPDDIFIHTHEKTLTDEEIKQGENYWRLLFAAEKNDTTEKEELKRNAWSKIVSLFSAQRSAWIAGQTKPTNWNNISALTGANQLIFPVHEQSKPFEWSRAPRTNVLPDKFVVQLYNGDSIAHEETGPVIPDELYMGPDPLESDKAFIEAADDKTLSFGEDYNWTSDFDKAIEKGMGFKIRLNADEALKGFDKILVIGVYSTSDQSQSQKTIGTLIDNHHYSPKGFSIIKQGTPTNNTEDDGSGFTKNDSFDAISFFVETGEPIFKKDEDCDGRDLVHGLGIEYEPLQYVLNSDAKDGKRSRAMNTALYPSTLGYYFSSMMKPVLSDTNQDMLRNFFNEHVSGRGPLAAIRVGNQPYGVLLTSDFGKWKWKERDGEFSPSFLNTLYNVLDHYHNIWKGLLRELMFTGKPGIDPSEVLVNILGLQPGSVSFFQRNAFSTEQLENLADFQHDGKYYKDFQNSQTSKTDLLVLLRKFGFEVQVVNGKLDIPQLLRLVYQHYHTRLSPDNVVENFPLSEKDGLHPYSGENNYIHWLIETNSITELERQHFGEDIKAPTSLLYMQLWRSLLLATADASVKWFGKNNIAVAHVMEPASFHNIRPARDLTKWEVMKGKLGIAAPQHPQKNKAVAEHLFTTGKHESEAAYLNQIKESLDILASSETASLERCFTDHIDTCTYRLDAWQTAIFDQRLKKQRNLTGTGEQPNRRTGIYLAAYGWVEDLRPGSKRRLTEQEIPVALQPPGDKPVYEYADNGGFVHAPSINQATAAAVLRSGYLARATSSNPDVMAVNLSSERIRRANFIHEGLRKGQSLEALLGFQFERGLHDRGSEDDGLKKLNEFIFDFRDKFPITQHLVQQQGAATHPAETIVKNNVVNGLTLAETKDAYPYGVSMNLGGLDPVTVQRVIEAEKNKLEDTLDALKDILLSESVFQMVQGNFDRAAAITNALRDATIPPAIEVIETPLTNHLGFTNRVTIQFDASANFGGASCRAKLEPGLNQWLRKITGEPADLICVASHKTGDTEDQQEVTMSDLGLEPIDLVYVAGMAFNNEMEKAIAAELESRVGYFYRKDKLLDDTVSIEIKFTGSTSDNKKFIGTILPILQTLRNLVTDSRPVHALDFDPFSRKSLADPLNPRGYYLDELEPRVNDAIREFESHLLEIVNLNISRTVGDSTIEITLAEMFNKLAEEGIDFNDIKFSFSAANADTLQKRLIDIAGFGLADSFPKAADITTENAKIVLLQQARVVTAKMTSILATIEKLQDELPLPDTIEKKVERLLAACKTLFDDTFSVLPKFNYNNPADIQLSAANTDQLLSFAISQVRMTFPQDEWIQKAAVVRPRIARWESIRTIHELTKNDQLSITPLQLPYRANDSWLAVEFPETNADGSAFTVIDDTLSIVIHGDTATATNKKQCGLLVDDWTELIPAKESTTGLSFNYNQPDAMAPQSLLLAVTPEETGSWNWDDLVSILNDTLLRAKLRAVEPRLLDKLKLAETGVLLPAVLSSFSQFGLDISLDYRNNVSFYNDNLPLAAIG